MDPLIDFLKRKAVEYYPGADIKPYLTMGIGGKARLVAVVYERTLLKELAVFLQSYHTDYPFVILGSGSNIIFPDEPSSLAVIVNRTGHIVLKDNNSISVDSGTRIDALMDWNVQNNCGGMDFLAGIPGTVGGASAVNAGAFGQSISSLLLDAEIVTPSGEVKTVSHDYFQFTYRDSAFKYGDDIILGVSLRYSFEPGSQADEKIKDRLAYRKQHHPCYDYRSAGCFFKNPIINGQKGSAGRLLEQAGFKGTQFRSLRISHEHANFLLNDGNATFDDIKAFEAAVTDAIFQREGIRLEREVIYISPDGKKY